MNAAQLPANYPPILRLHSLCIKTHSNQRLYRYQTAELLVYLKFHQSHRWISSEFYFPAYLLFKDLKLHTPVHTVRIPCLILFKHALTRVPADSMIIPHAGVIQRFTTAWKLFLTLPLHHWDFSHRLMGVFVAKCLVSYINSDLTRLNNMKNSSRIVFMDTNLQSIKQTRDALPWLKVKEYTELMPMFCNTFLSFINSKVTVTVLQAFVAFRSVVFFFSPQCL